MSFAATSTDIQEPLRITMLIFSAIQVFDLQWVPCIPFAVEDLRQSLDATLPILWDTAYDLLFWILFIGGMALRGLDCHQWVVAHLGEAADRLGMVDWNMALPLLQQFFFFPRASAKRPECLWNEVLSQRCYTAFV
ncbi:hypothetical protein BJX70DRAFT_368682 [Aspergillus crustosus]